MTGRPSTEYPHILGTGGPAVLPDDLLDAASRRLGIAAGVWAGLWTFSFLMNNLLAPVLSPDQPLDDAWPWPGNAVAWGVILVSLGVIAYTRWSGRSARSVLTVGLWYEVALAFGIGLTQQWTPNTAGLSWLCVLVLIHPMIVPDTPKRTLLAALAAASMDPLGIAITGARGVEVPSGAVVFWTYVPNYVCAFLAVLPSHVIGRLGGQVSEEREVGSYQLGQLLGHGGMGEVFRATHRMLRRPAAIKLVRPDALGSGRTESADTLVRRFLREAQAAASLHSPHTIALYDFGTTADGQLYYVMELLYGLDLETLIKRFGPMPPARVVYLLRQACHSLAEAHAAGLIHRDVKPTNIYACRVGLEVDFVKVLDFGLVKRAPGSQEEQVKLTAPNITMGTPAYMAPELARGEEIDHRIDIYALGCVANYLLTGALVFEGDTPMKVMVAHMRSLPAPPSKRAAAVPPELDDIVLACLEKDRARRPATVQELARRLDALGLHAAWGQDAAWAWWSKHLPDVRPDTSEPAEGRDGGAAGPARR